MIEILTATLAAGIPQTFHINGEYIEVLDAQYPLDVQVISRTGQPMSTMRGAEASFFSRPGSWGTILLTSVNAQVVKLFIGSGDAGTRRISSVVQVVDGGKARTLAGAAFLGVVSRLQVAAQNSQLQLWNPAGSGKNLFVKGYSLGATAAGGINVGFNTVALATLWAQGVSKQAGGATAVAQLRSNNNAVSALTAPYSDSFYGAALVTSQRRLEEPLMIGPGRGLVIEAGITDVTGAFEWVEEAI